MGPFILVQKCFDAFNLPSAFALSVQSMPEKIYGYWEAFSTSCQCRKVCVITNCYTIWSLSSSVLDAQEPKPQWNEPVSSILDVCICGIVIVFFHMGRLDGLGVG